MRRAAAVTAAIVTVATLPPASKAPASAFIDGSLDLHLRQHGAQAESPCELAQAVVVGQLIGDRGESADTRERRASQGDRGSEGEVT